MSIERSVLRNKAKKIYKDRIKTIPRKNRMPFPQFFKEFQKANQTANPIVETDEEDFNFDDLINTNEIDDDDVIVSESEEE